MEYLRGNYDSTDKIPKVSLSEVKKSLSDCEMIINKYDRIADGVNQVGLFIREMVYTIRYFTKIIVEERTL